jgi:hypothetical protein
MVQDKQIWEVPWYAAENFGYTAQYFAKNPPQIYF